MTEKGISYMEQMSLFDMEETGIEFDVTKCI